MLPPVIYMHTLDSSHCESQSGGSIELPSKEFWNFSGNHCFISTFLPMGPYRAPPAGGPIAAPSAGSMLRVGSS